MADTSASPVTIYDIDKMLSGATPQFSQQLFERIKAMIEPLPDGDEVREYGELQLTVLARIAEGTTRGTRALGVPTKDSSGWNEIPSHPSGGIAGTND